MENLSGKVKVKFLSLQPARKFWAFLAGIVSLVFLVHLLLAKSMHVSFFDFPGRFFSIRILTASIILSTTNWLLRIYKWKTLIKNIQPLSFREAAYQQLVSTGLAVWTPANAGEFVVKPLFFATNRKRLAGKVAIEQITQMIVTVCLGLIGTAGYFFRISPVVLLILAITVPLLFFLLRKNFGNIPFSTLANPEILLLSLGRYAAFSLLFGLLLSTYPGLQLSVMTLAQSIFTYYLLVSILPVIPWLDLGIKGSAAVFVFGKLGIDPGFVLWAVIWMWLWNFFGPALLGQILWFKRKFE